MTGKVSRRRFTGALVGGPSTFASSTAVGRGSDSPSWSTVQGDTTHTGYRGSIRDSPFGSSVIWEIDIGNELMASPVVADETVIVGTKDGRVGAFDLRDGTQRWVREGTTEIRRAAAVDDSTAFVNLDGQAMYALDIRTGETRWRTDLESRMYVNGGPVFADGTLYTADFAGNAYAIDANSGKIQWRRELTAGSPVGTIAVSDGRIVAAPNLIVNMLNAEDGQSIWTEEIGTIVWGPPTITNDVYLPIGGDPSVVAAISKETGELQWTATTSEEPASDEPANQGVTSVRPRSPIVTDDAVITADTGGTILAVNKADGSEIWRHTVEASPLHHPVATRGTVYLPTHQGLIALSMASGEVRWRALEGKTPTSPALVGDRMVVSTRDGKLIALGDEGSTLAKWRTEIGVGTAGLLGLGSYGAYRYLRSQQSGSTD